MNIVYGVQAAEQDTGEWELQVVSGDRRDMDLEE